MSEINESELAIWSEGTNWTVDDFVRNYTDYCVLEREAGREPEHESRWCSHVLGIPGGGEPGYYWDVPEKCWRK